MRQQIYTIVPEINESNVLDVLRRAFQIHLANAGELKYLYDFESGIQPILRKKIYRPEIDNHCVDNVAHEITSFHVGYEWGNPITLIQRGERDSGNKNESSAIALLNEQYEMQGIKTITQKLGRDVVIGNLGYTYIDINTDSESNDGNYFNINVLNPFTTFIIKSSYYIDGRDMAAVVFREDELHVRHFTVITRNARFEIKEDKIIFEEVNPLGIIPVVEWFGNYDGMGMWEHEIDEMNNLNLMVSDFTNAVETNLQCLWTTTDVEFATETVTLEDGTTQEVIRKPKNGDWMQLFSTPNGKTPKVEALTLDFDYNSQLANIESRRALILEKCYVPTRTDGQNSTGIAQGVASGWSTLDIVAESIQAIQESCKMKELKIVLAAIKHNPNVPTDSPLLKIGIKDVQPNVKRQRLSEMVSKVNAMSTMISHGINGLHAIKVCNLFPDPMQTYEDSKDLINRYQSSIFDKQNDAEGTEGEKKVNSDRLEQDSSDQTENSPMADNLSNGKQGS